MLVHLSIRNLAVVKHLDLDLHGGLTAITGETGAGKSIAIDALGLCLGARADASLVRRGDDKADVTAVFDIAGLTQAKAWLAEQALEDENECVIRRVIYAEGRSKAYINGSAVALQQLKQLGQHLINIHGQHAHHQLLKAEVQRTLLDNYAEHPTLLNNTAKHYQALQQGRKDYQALLSGQQQRADRRQLLAYQVEELDGFALAEEEFSDLEREHKKLSHGQTLLEQAQVSFHQLYESDEANALQIVQSALDRITELQEHDKLLEPIVGLLNEAVINIDEAAQELRHYTEQLEIDPLRLQQVEARYSQAMDLARKHQVQPEKLYQHHLALCDEFTSLQRDDDLVQQLESELKALEAAYSDAAEALSQSRQQAAAGLSAAVEKEIQHMNMPHAKFSVQVTQQRAEAATRFGTDVIGFQIATNPGQVPDTLDKVVSGGELSRVGLAIQVISSAKQQIPTMIFDEVDTGISGPTASVVGQLLRKLGKQTQVLCVTHLPQVAACGHHQMFVSKHSNQQSTETHMICLSENERIEELARLLAGDTLTESAIANAKELLDRQLAA